MPTDNGEERLVTYDETAQWHQWLRYVRHEPPTIEEQQRDLIRQAQIKKLAQIADEKWAAKPSFLDKPQTQQPTPATRTSDKTLHPPETSDPGFQGRPGVMNQIEGQEDIQQEVGQSKKTKGPAINVPTGPGEKWQPEAWTPDASRR
jgi:NADH dehydrogenase [ubiquinone] 1 alpha subcomplex assembly factor 2